MEDLTNDVLIFIFSFLHFYDWNMLRLVSTRFHSLVDYSNKFLLKNYPSVHAHQEKIQRILRIISGNGVTSCTYNSSMGYEFIKRYFSIYRGKQEISKGVFKDIVYCDINGVFKNSKQTRNSLLFLNFHDPYYYHYTFKVNENLRFHSATEMSAGSEEYLLSDLYEVKKWKIISPPSKNFFRRFIRKYRDFGNSELHLTEYGCEYFSMKMLLAILFPSKLDGFVDIAKMSRVSYKRNFISINSIEDMFDLRDYFYRKSGVTVLFLLECFCEKAIEIIHKITCCDENLSLFEQGITPVDDCSLLPYRVNVHEVFYFLGLIREKPPEKFCNFDENIYLLFRKRAGIA